MNNNEEAVKPRRVIVEVNDQAQRSVRKRRKPKRWQKNLPSKEMMHTNDDSVDAPDPQDSIPMELQPVIRAALDYGKKTHASGALRAAQTLTFVAQRLKFLCGSQPEVLALASEAELEAQNIRDVFSRMYNG